MSDTRKYIEEITKPKTDREWLERIYAEIQYSRSPLVETMAKVCSLLRESLEDDCE